MAFVDIYIYVNYSMPRDDEENIEGSLYTLKHCKGALKTKKDTYKRAQPGETKVLDQLIQRFVHLGETQLSARNFPREGCYEKGDQKVPYHAIKKPKQLRVYCFQCPSDPSTWYVSHYSYKKDQKLPKLDKEKIESNIDRVCFGDK